jgi:hypothetical protein
MRRRDDVFLAQWLYVRGNNQGGFEMTLTSEPAFKGKISKLSFDHEIMKEHDSKVYCTRMSEYSHERQCQVSLTCYYHSETDEHLGTWQYGEGWFSPNGVTWCEVCLGLADSAPDQNEG